jgi:hypothetical protein
MNYGDVCRTAPATPGLLKILDLNICSSVHIKLLDTTWI